MSAAPLIRVPARRMSEPSPTDGETTAPANAAQRAPEHPAERTGIWVSVTWQDDGTGRDRATMVEMGRCGSLDESAPLRGERRWRVEDLDGDQLPADPHREAFRTGRAGERPAERGEVA